MASKEKSSSTIQAHESAEQKALFRWAAFASGKYPELGWLYHVPNGGKRDPLTGKRLKAEGVKAGVPDLCLPVSRGGYHGLYIELKCGQNKTTPHQDKGLEFLEAQGYFIAVCYGWEDAIQKLTAYLEGEELSPAYWEAKRLQESLERQRKQITCLMERLDEVEIRQEGGENGV